MTSKGKRIVRITAALGIAALGLSGCAVNEPRLGETTGLSGLVVGGGASSQQAAQEAWVVGFQTENMGATVEYDPAGSGAGREMFIAGGSAFAGSDRAFTVEELEEESFESCVEGSDIVEIPAYISPIAIAFNVEGVDSLNMDATTIANIFSNEVTHWNDEAILAQNPGVDLPDARITAIHRSDDSGVTENFTEYLAAVAPKEWPYEPSGEWPLEGGESGQGTSGVASSLINGANTIAYIDASRVGDLGIVSVKVGEKYVPYSSEAAAAIIDESPIGEGRSDVDLAVEIDRTSTAEGVYPIVLISYLIGCAEYKDAEDGELVRAYFEHVISDEAQRTAAEIAGSAPISQRLFERVSAAVSVMR